MTDPTITNITNVAPTHDTDAARPAYFTDDEFVDPRPLSADNVETEDDYDTDEAQNDPEVIKVGDAASVAPLNLSGDVIKNIGVLLHVHSKNRRTDGDISSVLGEATVTIQQLRNELQSTNITLQQANVKVEAALAQQPQIQALHKDNMLKSRGLEAMTSILMMIKGQ